jgi:hypothetical protein
MSMAKVNDWYTQDALVADFDKLTSSIETACSSIIDAIHSLDSNKALSSKNTLRGLAWDSLMKAPVDVIVDTLIRFRVSERLHCSLTRFHPTITEDNQIEKCYDVIRITG